MCTPLEREHVMSRLLDGMRAQQKANLYPPASRVAYNYGPTSDYNGPIRGFPPLPTHMDRA